MRVANIGVLLLVYVLVLDVDGQLVWTEVDKDGVYPVSTAKHVATTIFRLQPSQYLLYTDYADATWPNFFRFTRYRVIFRIHLQVEPYSWHTCRGDIAWPKSGGLVVHGGIGTPTSANNCT